MKRKSSVLDVTTFTMAIYRVTEAFHLNVRSFALSSLASLLFLFALLVTIYAVLNYRTTFSLVYNRATQHCTFFYATFLKPHPEDDGSGQQAALESFYKVQVPRMKDTLS